LEKVPDELDVVLPSAVIDTEKVCTEAEIESTLAAVAVPIPAPAAMETLEDVPFSEKLVAAGTVGPTMVMACNDCDRVMLFPPTNVANPLVMLLVTPAVLPEVPMTMPLWIVGPPMEITPAPLEETVMLFPPDTVIGPLDKEPAGPIDETTEPVEEMVILEPRVLKPIPVPATKLTLDDKPLSEKFVAAGTFGPEIVIA